MTSPGPKMVMTPSSLAPPRSLGAANQNSTLSGRALPEASLPTALNETLSPTLAETCAGMTSTEATLELGSLGGSIGFWAKRVVGAEASISARRLLRPARGVRGWQADMTAP